MEIFCLSFPHKKKFLLTTGKHNLSEVDEDTEARCLHDSLLKFQSPRVNLHSYAALQGSPFDIPEKSVYLLPSSFPVGVGNMPEVLSHFADITFCCSYFSYSWWFVCKLSWANYLDHSFSSLVSIELHVSFSFFNFWGIIFKPHLCRVSYLSINCWPASDWSEYFLKIMRICSSLFVQGISVRNQVLKLQEGHKTALALTLHRALRSTSDD